MIKSDKNAKNHATLKLPAGTTQSSIQRVLEWNNQPEVDISTASFSKSEPPSPINYSGFQRLKESVANSALQQKPGAIRDDMCLPNKAFSPDHDSFHLMQYADANRTWNDHSNHQVEMEEAKKHNLNNTPLNYEVGTSFLWPVTVLTVQ